MPESLAVYVLWHCLSFRFSWTLTIDSFSCYWHMPCLFPPFWLSAVSSLWSSAVCSCIKFILKVKAYQSLKSFDWTSIRKLALCEDHGRRYVCISTDPDLSPEYTHMYGIIMAPFHCKNCISFPVDPVLIETLEKHSSRSGVVLEHTGSIKNGPIQSTRKISGPIVLIAFMALIMCLILLVWSILFLS